MGPVNEALVQSALDAMAAGDVERLGCVCPLGVELCIALVSGLSLCKQSAPLEALVLSALDAMAGGDVQPSMLLPLPLARLLLAALCTLLTTLGEQMTIADLLMHQ